MTAPRVAGLDLSLTSTGIAHICASLAWADLVKPGDRKGHARMSYLADQILDRLGRPALTVVEGPSYGSAATSAYAHEGAGLWWLITRRLWKLEIPYAVVTPKQRAKYATGNGNAGKEAVLIAAVKRYPDVEINGNDQADALILAAMGADHLGHPLAPVPATHRAALAAVDWPEMTT